MFPPSHTSFFEPPGFKAWQIGFYAWYSFIRCWMIDFWQSSYSEQHVFLWYWRIFMRKWLKWYPDVWSSISSIFVGLETWKLGCGLVFRTEPIWYFGIRPSKSSCFGGFFICCENFSFLRGSPAQTVSLLLLKLGPWKFGCGLV